MTEIKNMQLQAFITSTLNVVITHADELTRLDQAIGDGDHGINMKRGAEKIMQELSAIYAKPDGEALKF